MLNLQKIKQYFFLHKSCSLPIFKNILNMLFWVLVPFSILSFDKASKRRPLIKLGRFRSYPKWVNWVWWNMVYGLTSNAREIIKCQLSATYRTNRWLNITHKECKGNCQWTKTQTVFFFYSNFDYRCLVSIMETKQL